MLFNSVQFIIFLPVVVLIYFIVPGKLKQISLLIFSYYFYMCWNPGYVLLLLLSTATTYFGGLMIEKVRQADCPEDRKVIRKKGILSACLIINLGILYFFKYFNFSASCFTAILSFLHIQVSIPKFDILLPVGISFYTFQVAGYLIDVYRDKICAEKNFIHYALFVSFFPQLAEGPIERAGNLLKQLAVPSRFSFDNFREGILLMLWGFFLKIVLADRIAVFVDTVYTDYVTFSGYYILIATVLFAVQIYCDFYGYSSIAVGAAKIFGIQLTENFNAPYLSSSVAVFWRNWHISLTSWFKDYLYIPLGGSRKGKCRKHINRLIVFLVSGLWHGADLSFVIWGGINGVYQIAGELLLPLRTRMVRWLHLNPNSIAHRLMRIAATFIMIDFTWLFFRASSIRDAVKMIRLCISVHNPWILFDGSLYGCGLDNPNFHLVLVCIAILLFSDICRQKGICVRKVILAQDYWFRWLFFAGSVLLILLFGKWGPAFNAGSFIYFQF